MLLSVPKKKKKILKHFDRNLLDIFSLIALPSLNN